MKIRDFALIVAAAGTFVGGAHAQGVAFAVKKIETVKLAGNLFVLTGGSARGNIVVLTSGALGDGSGVHEKEFLNSLAGGFMCIRKLKDLVLLFAVAGICAGTIRAQGVDFAAQKIETVKLAGNLFVLMGGPAQGNIVVLTGSDGLFLIDSMYGPMHPKIMEAIGKLSTEPIRYLVNTHVHGDHTGGNEAMAKLGAVIISHDNMRKRMLLPQTNAPAPGSIPSMTYSDSLTLHFDGEEIYIYHPEPAHTDGDSIVYFRHANVMHVGDVPSSLRYPNIGVTDGGSVEGMIAAAQQVMKIANPQTKIIPGHLGPVVGFDEIQQQLAMFTAVRDRVAAAIRAGKTQQEVVASKPTADFDQGRMGGAITPDRFVTLVYQDLSRKVK